MIYEVEEINIDMPVAIRDTARFLLKEVIVSEDSLTPEIMEYKMERYFKTNKDKDWNINDVWVIHDTKNYTIVNEENIRIVKLVYPLDSFSTWNGNIYNNLGELFFEVDSMNIDCNLNGINYDSVAVIIQESFESIFEKSYQIEKYAKNTGLIYKESIEIESQNYDNYQVDVSVPLMERITKGTIYKRTLLSISRGN